MDLTHVPSLCAFGSVFLYSLVLVINLFPPSTVQASAFGNETDRLALLKFKESVATDPHGLFNSWNSSFHFCKWHGITCGRRHQRVIALNLEGYDLHGSISPSIGNLSYLRLINLQNNSFSGNIPQQVDRLFSLQHLNLSSNMLKGGIPANLTFCPELSIIHVAENHLTGKVPSEMGSLKKLVYLNLEDNHLTGGISPSLGNLSSITSLGLEFNNLAGTIPEEIGQLRSLAFLSLGPNNLSGTVPPSLFNISSMIILSMPYNNLKGSIPPSIGQNMPNLQQLFLSTNEFSGTIPSSLSNASQLQQFDLGYNSFVGQIPIGFGNLPDLQWFTIGHNNLGSNSSNDLAFIPSLTNCSNMEAFSISYNNFGGVLPNSIGNLSTHLIHLYLGGNQISGMIPASLENLKNLIALGLETNLLAGIIPTSIGRLQRLQLLILHENGFSGHIPSSLGNLTSLYRLFLVGNQLEGSIPPSIFGSNLQVLSMSYNRLTGNIPAEVVGLSSVVRLYLSQNSLTGSLPVELGKLKSLESLDISENNLTEEIPEIIGECLSLEDLYLQGNLFKGRIPSSLATLKGLQNLDLSQNNLSGQIPKDLQRLSYLLYLNLSFNQLEGEVPKEGAFRNTSAISLDGNSQLCGGVSKLELPACPTKGSNKGKLHSFKLNLTISLVSGCSVLFAVFLALYCQRRRKAQNKNADDSSVGFLSKVSYQTLYQATSGFSPSALIGSGGSGSVYKGILDQEERKVVAIKVLNLHQNGASKSFTAECNTLRNIRHRNLVKILTCCSSMDHNGNDFKALVFEYMSNQSLEERLHSPDQSTSLNLIQRLNIAVDVASALCYLHDHCEPQIIHRDIKPSNVLLDDETVAHVADFGIARLMSTNASSSQNPNSTVGIKGTIGYAAPEYAVGAEPSKQSDVYSYGILVLQMFTGRRPTEEMFKDGLNLHNFVKMTIPGRLMQIVDSTLLATLEETAPDNEVSSISGCNNQIEAEEKNIEYANLRKLNTYVWKCILPVLNIGLACSEESPRNRMSMEDATRGLHHIVNAYTGVQVQREKPRRT